MDKQHQCFFTLLAKYQRASGGLQPKYDSHEYIDLLH
jgi:hypothetical protein